MADHKQRVNKKHSFLTRLNNKQDTHIHSTISSKDQGNYVK